MDELKKYFAIVNRIRGGRGDVSQSDIEFFLSYTPEIDEAKMKKLIEGGEFASQEEASAAMIEAGRALQSSPEYKEKLLQFAEQAEQGKLSDKLASGINLVLGTTDIGISINQIRQANKAAKQSRRPSRPSVPRRDLMLQQALRSAEEGTFDAARATAPVEAQINDQYLEDVQNAKTASTGQAGAYGAYRQLAANRRNRSALQLAPIQDEIRRGQQARYDNLLGMRLGETQNMFQNQASLYPYDLNQYNLDQRAAAGLGATGRENLRGSLYNLGNQAANFAASNYIKRKYDRLRNQALTAGIDPGPVIKAEQNLQGYMGIPQGSWEEWNQFY